MKRPFPETSNQKSKVAAIDVGSNSIHLLVAETNASGEITQVIETAKDQTRLGEALGERLLLDADAMNRAATALKRMKDIADSHGARIRAIGTHAMREAKNGREFASRLLKKTGVNVEIVSGQEEARLVYLGVQQGLSIHEKSTLVVDIGGGSTEILVGQWGEERFSTSLKLGAVRLTQKYIKTEQLADSDLAEMRRYVMARLEPIIIEIRRVGFDFAVGSSGTIKAIKSLALGLQNKPQPTSFHGEILTSSEIRLAVQAIERAKSLRERKLLPNMDSKRADIIVAGAIILDTLTQLAGISEWTISLTAIREGIIHDTLVRDQAWVKGDPADIRWRSVRAFGQKVHVDEIHAWHITSLSVSLFDQLRKRHNLSLEWREYLRSAAYLHECGRFLGYTGHHKHAFYLLRHACLLGFSTRELDAIALIVRYHRKRAPRDNDEVYSELEPDEKFGVRCCGAILRVAVSLDRGRQGKIQEIRLVDLGAQLRMDVHLRGSQDISLEMYHASSEKMHFEAAFGVGLQIGTAFFSNPATSFVKPSTS